MPLSTFNSVFRYLSFENDLGPGYRVGFHPKLNKPSLTTWSVSNHLYIQIKVVGLPQTMMIPYLLHDIFLSYLLNTPVCSVHGREVGIGGDCIYPE